MKQDAGNMGVTKPWRCFYMKKWTKSAAAAAALIAAISLQTGCPCRSCSRSRVKNRPCRRADNGTCCRFRQNGACQCGVQPNDEIAQISFQTSRGRRLHGKKHLSSDALAGHHHGAEARKCRKGEPRRLE